MDKIYTVSVLYKPDAVCCIWESNQKLVKIANLPQENISFNQFNVDWSLFDNRWKEFISSKNITRIDKLILHHPVFCILPVAYYTSDKISTYLQMLFEGIGSQDITHVKLDDQYFLIYSYPQPLKKILNQSNTVIQVQHLAQRIYARYLNNFSSGPNIEFYFDGQLSYYFATSSRGLHLINAYKTVDKYDRLYFALMIRKVVFTDVESVKLTIFNNGEISSEELKMFENYFQEVVLEENDLDSALLKSNSIIEF